jgi:steroid delta-isomerase-like uncharacterized protein
MSSTEESKALALRWDEVWHHGTGDDLDAIFAADFVDHAPSDEETHGLERFKARWRLLKDAFTDLTFAYQHLIAEGEYVVLHWIASGTHRGDYLGYPATGRRVAFHGNTIFRVVDGKFTERWTYQDTDHLIQQLRGDTTAVS